ncbi:MAG TPA: LiaF domain-containing protein, partial [Puia sp.]
MAIPDDNYSRRGPGRVWAGLFLLAVGGVLLLYQMGFPIPEWLFSWHILLIALGLFIGLRHNFRGAGWLILIAIGGIYTIQDYYPDMHLHKFIWPGILMMVGLIIILRPGRHHYRNEWQQEWQNAHQERWRRRWERRYGRPYVGPDATQTAVPPYGTDTSGTTSAFGSSQSYSADDFIDTTSIFGGVHKKIVSKNFKGGDITTMLGGTEIDLTQADFTGTVRLDVTQIMGGTKIIVPPHWEVRSEVTAVFAGFEDKRQQPA